MFKNSHGTKRKSDCLNSFLTVHFMQYLHDSIGIVSQEPSLFATSKHQHTHAHMHTHMHSHMRTLAHTYTHMHAHAHRHPHKCKHIHVHAHMHAHACTCTRMHAHAEFHTRTNHTEDTPNHSRTERSTRSTLLTSFRSTCGQHCIWACGYRAATDRRSSEESERTQLHHAVPRRLRDDGWRARCAVMHLHL